MRSATRVAWSMAGLVIISGCRTAARVMEMPRVDLALEEGNRGYLIGTPPSPSEQKTTRQMVGADIEIPSFYKPKASGASVSLDDVLPPDAGAADRDDLATASGPALFDAYAVQKGDTLWAIAAKPEIYGNANHWRRIFEANRELLKSPDRVRVGMTLKIPRGTGGDAFPAESDEGLTFKK